MQRASLLHRRVWSTLARRRYASHGTPHYNEPGGYLFSEVPPPAGTKRVKEDWENVWIYGWAAVLTVGAVGLYYKPDKRVTTWAYDEAKKRMEERGELPTFEPTPKERWD